jgi:hypothetical protein
LYRVIEVLTELRCKQVQAQAQSRKIAATGSCGDKVQSNAKSQKEERVPHDKHLPTSRFLFVSWTKDPTLVLREWVLDCDFTYSIIQVNNGSVRCICNKRALNHIISPAYHFARQIGLPPMGNPGLESDPKRSWF